MRKVCHHNWDISTDGCVPDGRHCLQIETTQRVVCHHTRFKSPCDQTTKCIFDNGSNVLLNHGESVVCHHYDFKEFGATCNCGYVDNTNVKKVTGLLSLVLHPQPDPNPPHKVHPIMIPAVYDWISDNPDSPVLWIRNASGRQVLLYMRQFHRDNSAPADSAIQVPPVSGNTNQQSIPIPFGQRSPNVQKLWYGFAFQGEYANAAAYFAEHPAGHGHHTQNIPPSRT